VCLSRHLVDQLVVVHDRDDRRTDANQRAVVEAAAATESVAPQVDRQRGHQDDIGTGERVCTEAWRDRLTQAEWSWDELVRSGVERPVEGRAVDHWHEHTYAAIEECVEQVPGRWFTGHGDVGGDRRTVMPLREAVATDGGARLGSHGVGHLIPAGEDGGPQRLFAGCVIVGHVSSVPSQDTRVASMSSGVTKAVVPVAGLGTRFLPATKATPKEMLPVVDKPAIQYVVEEAVRAGLDDVLLVTGRNKTPLEDHFDSAYELEDKLEADAGKRHLLDRVRSVTELATVHYVRQGAARGLGHAVLCAAQHVGDEPFAVLLGDDLIDERDVLLTDMVGIQKRLGGCVIALMEVPRDQIGLYGCAAAEATDEADVVRITGLVEKPAPDEAPSNFAIIGRYVLSPEIFDVLRHTPPGRGGEVQLTDAIEQLTDRPGAGGPVHGVVFRGRRYDTGDKADYLKAIVQLACDRADLGPGFREWLAEFVAVRLPQGEPPEPLRL
jgi:UTP--glucose-1-phosphate uridylyltransferase